jgi:hypothetical protein
MSKEVSEKLFTSLEKMLVDEVIDQYISKTPSSSSLHDKQQQKTSPS